LSELALIQVELGAEFDSESNGDIFRPGFRSKNGTLSRNTDFLDFFEKYLASGFAILFELSLKVVELNSAINSASNDTIFDWGHRAKIFWISLTLTCPCSPDRTLIEIFAR
jgi:hypothetical protein